jgi:hypothetical protein
VLSVASADPFSDTHAFIPQDMGCHTQHVVLAIHYFLMLHTCDRFSHVPEHTPLHVGGNKGGHPTMHQMTSFCSLIEVNARGELRLSSWVVKGKIELTDVCGLWEAEPHSTTRYHSAHIVPVTICGDGTNSS